MSTATTQRTEGATAWAIEPGALRRLAPVFLAGGVAGLAGGVWVRIVMRLSALAAPDAVQGLTTEAGATIGRITFEGTVFLVLFAGIGSAIGGTAFYLAVRAWLPTRRRTRAIVFGVLELLVFGTIVIDATNPDFTTLGHPAFNVLLFAAGFVLHGMLLVLLQRPARRFVDAVAGGVRWRERLVGVASALAGLLIVFGLFALGSRGGSTERVLALVLVACAAALAFVEPGPGRPVRRVAFVVGGLALALVALGGALGLLDQVTAIV